DRRHRRGVPQLVGGDTLKVGGARPFLFGGRRRCAPTKEPRMLELHVDPSLARRSMVRRLTPDERVDSPGRVLVVDDELVINRAYCRLLANAGYEVASAPDGARA